jgi:hypothetical protein
VVLLTPISRRYDLYTRKGIKPTTTAYVDLVKKEMEDLKKAFLIVDALDECPEIKRREFLYILDGLPPSVNVFLTSRDDIHPHMTRKMQELIIRATDDDVETHARSHLEEERDSPQLGYHLLEQPSLREILYAILYRKQMECTYFILGNIRCPAASIPCRKYSQLTSSIGSYSLSFI